MSDTEKPYLQKYSYARTNTQTHIHIMVCVYMYVCSMHTSTCISLLHACVYVLCCAALRWAGLRCAALALCCAVLYVCMWALFNIIVPEVDLNAAVVA